MYNKNVCFTFLQDKQSTQPRLNVERCTLVSLFDKIAAKSFNCFQKIVIVANDKN